MSDYKASKEAFVSDATGSSISHINLLSLVALSSVFAFSCVQSRYPLSTTSPRIWKFGVEFILLVMPLLLSMTLLASRPLLLSLVMIIPAILLVISRPPQPSGDPLLPLPTLHFASQSIPRSPSPSPTHSRQNSYGDGLSSRGLLFPDRSSSSQLSPTPPLGPSADLFVRDSSSSSSKQTVKGAILDPLPYITTYRAHMMLMTILAILAVDFPVFPRYLAKCESFGVSLMDLGVGSFVFSQGLVSAIPVLKNPAHLSAPVMPKLVQVARKVSPLIVLGLVRVLLVKGTEYPEHITEYGVHWNFFITLALLPLLSVFIHPLIPHLPISLLGVILTSAHQILLRTTSLQTWVLSSESRLGLISMNKEGIVSLPGYLAIHTLGLLTGTLLLPPSPSHFRRTTSKPLTSSWDTPNLNDSNNNNDKARSAEKRGANARDPVKAAIELCSYTVVWWTEYFVATFLNIGGGGIGAEDLSRTGVSRRLANLPYVLWIAAFNTSLLLGYLVIDIIFNPSLSSSSPTSRSVSHHRRDSSDDISTASTTTANFDPPVVSSATLSPRVPKRSHSYHQLDQLVLSDAAVQNIDGGGAGGVGNGAQNERRAPELFEAINLNGLALFLLANLLTGLVNVCVRTMYATDVTAMCVLVGYTAFVCFVGWICRGEKLLRL